MINVRVDVGYYPLAVGEDIKAKDLVLDFNFSDDNTYLSTVQKVFNDVSSSFDEQFSIDNDGVSYLFNLSFDAEFKTVRLRSFSIPCIFDLNSGFLSLIGGVSSSSSSSSSGTSSGGSSSEFFEVVFEYFPSLSSSKVIPTNSYASGDLVLHFFLYPDTETSTPKAVSSFVLDGDWIHTLNSKTVSVGGNDYKFILNLFGNIQNDYKFLFHFPYAHRLRFNDAFSILLKLLYAPNDNSSGGTASVDLSPIQAILNSISSKVDSLSSGSNNSSGFNLFDLNGQYGSYRNGTMVNIAGLEDKYEVISSSLVWDDKIGALMIIYDLKNERGEICPSSHPLLTPVKTTTTTTGS